MSRRRFLISLAVMFTVVIAFNLLLALRLDSVSKQIVRGMQAQPQIDLLFVGNSLTQNGVDVDTIKSVLPASTGLSHPFNAGLGSSSPVEQYLIAREAFRLHPSIPHLIYGIYDLQLTQSNSYGWSDLVGNRAMAYSSDPVMAASLYAPHSALISWEFCLIGAVPMLREHSQLWKQVEVLRRGMQSFGMPKVAENSLGRVADFDQMGSPDVVAMLNECEASARDRVPFSPPIQALLQLAHAHNADVTVVEMPMKPDHRRIYYSTPAWQHYRDYIRQQLEATGATYVVANDWVPDGSQFEDAIHLNSEGAKIYSTHIAQYWADRLQAK